MAAPSIGAMIFNGIFFAGTLIFGSQTAPSVWVSLIAMTNVALLMTWHKSGQRQPPTHKRNG